MQIVRLLIQTIAHVRRRKQSQMCVEPRETVLNLKRSCYVAAALLSAASPTFANELSGTWLRDTGEARVEFESCGDAMCGTIIWLKPGIDSKAKIGQRVFYDMKPAGPNAWSGKAFGPDTGSVYLGKLSVQGSNLSGSGCIAGGMICRSMNWTRVP
jgi:uncharacterized protein (DUF2147 family)